MKAVVYNIIDKLSQKLIINWLLLKFGIDITKNNVINSAFAGRKDNCNGGKQFSYTK